MVKFADKPVKKHLAKEFVQQMQCDPWSEPMMAKGIPMDVMEAGKEYKHKVPASVIRKMVKASKKLIFATSDMHMGSMTNPCMEVPLPSVVGGKAIRHKVEKVVKVFAPVLPAPRSKFGQMVKEKLEKLKKGC